jgi:vitellogenic carboxypeptidase-like protein
MMSLWKSLFIIIYLLNSVRGFDPLRRRLASVPRTPILPGDDPGEPLFLTPYIESGQIDQARNLSRVNLQPAYSYPSYSGYLTVNKTHQSNLFFWFFPAQNGDTNTPLLVWLQGGPGSSSLFGLFAEQGPIMVDKQQNLHPRNITWNSKYHLLFIDQPVGTGYSFTKSEDGYVRNEDEVARDLYAMLIQFFVIYHEYAASPFYVTGESYGGKYVPAIVYKIHIENPQAKTKINLKGMAIGDGLIDPYNEWDYGPVMYQFGLIDEQELERVNLQTDLARTAIELKQYLLAYALFSNLLDLFYTEKTGLNDVYNYLLTQSPESFGYYVPWVTASDNRRKIHVGNLTYNDGAVVGAALANDIMQSIVDKVAVIADNNYKILIYNGLLDVIIASSLTMDWVDKLEWQYADELRNAERKIWKVNDDDPQVAGYIKQAHSFFVAWVRNAGHMVPAEQPRAAFDLIDRFVSA